MLQLYNTLSKQPEPFKPITAGRVTMYSCGPTVYSHPHIGNFRSFITADILRRYLEYSGYEVKQVMNITDVGHMTTDDLIGADGGEDKIEAMARKEKKSPTEIARFYEDEFMELSRMLNLRPAFKYPRATDHITEMIELIRKLIEKGYAYEVNGNVYYEVTKFKDYGRLSGNTLNHLLAGARVEVNPEKKNPLDFALWKHDPKHLMQWDSPWSKGFPGWHIECSAMSVKYLGVPFDIHTGGEDNIFPHHESEIAQSEAALGVKAVNYWFHTRHLLVDNQKMSKSLGNFYTVRDILDKGDTPRVLRYALMSVYYRQPLNFTFASLEAAQKAVERLLDFKRNLRFISSQIQDMAVSAYSGIPTPRDINSAVKEVILITKTRFDSAMDDDLNISEALASIFDMVRLVNKITLSPSEATAVLKSLERFDVVLGVLGEESTNLEAEIAHLIEERQTARRKKDYQKADELRRQLDNLGIILEDTPQGVRWKRKI